MLKYVVTKFIKNEVENSSDGEVYTDDDNDDDDDSVEDGLMGLGKI